jgi:hypothetical protein
LDQIGTAHDGILMDAVKVRLVPETTTLQFARPTGAACTQISTPPARQGNHWLSNMSAYGLARRYDLSLPEKDKQCRFPPKPEVISVAMQRTRRRPNMGRLLSLLSGPLERMTNESKQATDA